MPRVRRAQVLRPIAKINLRSYPSTEPVATVSTEVLSSQLFTRPPAQRISRQRFGRGLDMDRIETALRSAYRGSMRGITDISRETIDVDPHLGAVLNKRFGAVSTLPWENQPANGMGIDDEKAMFYSEVCNEQLKSLRNFRQNLKQLAWALFDGRACLELKWVKLNPQFAISHPRYGRPTWALESMSWVHPRRLSFGPRRELQIENEENANSGGNFSAVGLPVDELPFKFVYWTPQLFAEYPEREGLAPRCLYWSFFKRYGARERMILAELFGKPWRVIEVDQESTAGQPEMEAADEIVDALGSAYTARLPRGTKLNVVQPGNNAGNIHKDIIKESDEQISKLVLGQTGTTDGTASGFNNNQANVMQDEQFMILSTDAFGLAEQIETFVTDAIIVLNFGPEESRHAPHFVLRSDIPADRNSELERLTKTLASGIPVKLDEAYEVSGFSKPNPDDDIMLRIEQPPTPAGSPNAPAPRPVIVFPSGASPAVGEQQPTPSTAAVAEGARENATADIALTASDLGTVITVNEARSSQNLDPLLLPGGVVDPDGDLTIAEFKAAKQAAKDKEAAAGDVAKAEAEARKAEAESTEEPPSPDENGDDPDDEPPDDEGGPGSPPGGEPPPDGGGTNPDDDVAASKASAPELTAALMAKLLVDLGDYDPDNVERQERMILSECFHVDPDPIFEHLKYIDDVQRALCLECADVTLVKDFQQQEGPTGNPEDIVTRGIQEVLRETEKLAKAYRAGVKGLDKPTEIFSAINRTDEATDTAKLARALERHMLLSLMMGALDNRAEQEGGLDAGAETIEEVEEQGAKVGSEVEDRAKALEVFSRDNVCTFGREQGGIVLLAGSPPPDFAKMAFREATNFFKKLKVMSKAEFARASVEVQRKAFTVAGVTNKQMVAVIQHELVKQIAAGTSLAQFSTALDTRLKSAGFLATPLKSGALSASHVETVFRTNTLNAYNVGRLKQASQPSVARAFPAWLIRTASDSRVRSKHAALNGKKLRAGDPFWRTSYPPFDFNCRCRVQSKRSMKGVVEGTLLTAPGSNGFVSGIANLL